MTSNFTSSIPSSLHRDSADWLISAIDPFHDFDHPIEGAPDHVVSKSYTRKYVQSATVAATADGDNLSVMFTGFHGAANVRFMNWGADGYCDAASAATIGSIAPVMVLRRAAGNYGSLSGVVGGSTDVLSRLNTAQIGTIPSRLVSLGIEVTDITQSLYKRGAMTVAHANGESELINIAREDATAVTPIVTSVLGCVKPSQPWSINHCVSIPGSYTGPASKGAYVAARLNEIRPPTRGLWDAPNGTTYGASTILPVLEEPDSDPGDTDSRRMVPISDSGFVAEWPYLAAATSWCDSGFSPFTMLITGVSSFSTFQVVLKTTVEYFPQASHPFECGLATFSPVYDPMAFRMYHEIMRQIPAAVPVSMNPAGEYWQMLMAAARRAYTAIRANAGNIGSAMSVVGTALGSPMLAGAGQVVALAQPKQAKQAKKKQPTNGYVLLARQSKKKQGG